MGKIAFVFAGQGSQKPGMGKDLYESSPVVKHIFDMAGDKIKELCFNSTQEELNKTENAQPCIYTLGLAMAANLNNQNIKPAAVAGFSVGEVAAVVYAGMMDFSTGLRFVKFRARCMANAANEISGGMVAVLKLKAKQVEEICKQTGAWAVNYNCDTQTVVAYEQSDLEELQERVKSAGGRCVKLATSGAFHSPLMNMAKLEVEEYLKSIEFKNENIPVFSNITGEPYKDNKKDLLASQINNPVLWQKTIENMLKLDYDTFYEVGSGEVLTGLIKKIRNENNGGKET